MDQHDASVGRLSFDENAIRLSASPFDFWSVLARGCPPFQSAEADTYSGAYKMEEQVKTFTTSKIQDAYSRPTYYQQLARDVKAGLWSYGFASLHLRHSS